jgi:acyl-CoA synthetase (AMP-forming)/AMP-acid ligase II
MRVTKKFLAPALIAQLRRGLAGFKVPQTILFVSEIPRSPGGKVLRAELLGRWRRARENEESTR